MHYHKCNAIWQNGIYCARYAGTLHGRRVVLFVPVFPSTHKSKFTCLPYPKLKFRFCGTLLSTKYSVCLFWIFKHCGTTVYRGLLVGYKIEQYLLPSALITLWRHCSVIGQVMICIGWTFFAFVFKEDHADLWCT